MRYATTPERSRIMAAIRRSGTDPEMELRRQLAVIGLRPGHLAARLPGSPDIVFSRQHIAVFVDGCFWHGCREHRSIPKSNRELWLQKITGNRRRDRRVDRQLRASGWCPMRVWEHDIGRDVGPAALRVAAAVFDRSSVRPIPWPRDHTFAPTAHHGARTTTRTTRARAGS
ncbi:MAG TPA: very short patch repair endonuclease [Burkholderiales bacterium]